MKMVKFKGANSTCGKLYLTSAYRMAKFKPTFMERVKLLFGFPMWMAVSRESNPSISVYIRSKVEEE